MACAISFSWRLSGLKYPEVSNLIDLINFYSSRSIPSPGMLPGMAARCLRREGTRSFAPQVAGSRSFATQVVGDSAFGTLQLPLGTWSQVLLAISTAAWNTALESSRSMSPGAQKNAGAQDPMSPGAQKKTLERKTPGRHRFIHAQRVAQNSSPGTQDGG